jgi:hypothetical protein
MRHRHDVDDDAGGPERDRGYSPCYTEWVKKFAGGSSTKSANQFDQNLKFYLNMLEKLIKDEYNRNGLVFLNHLISDKNFLRAVASLSLEVRRL